MVIPTKYSITTLVNATTWNNLCRVKLPTPKIAQKRKIQYGKREKNYGEILNTLDRLNESRYHNWANYELLECVSHSPIYTYQGDI